MSEEIFTLYQHSGSGCIPLPDASGSGRAKKMWILNIIIRKMHYNNIQIRIRVRYRI